MLKQRTYESTLTYLARIAGVDYTTLQRNVQLLLPLTPQHKQQQSLSLSIKKTSNTLSTCASLSDDEQ